MKWDFEGKVAVVTGAGKGIGAATARGIAEGGGRVAVLDVDADAGRAVADELGDAGRFIELDVTDRDGIPAAFDAAAARFGGIDVLVNNAGGSRAHPFLEATEAIWREDLEIKVFGAIRFSRAVLPHLRARGGGRIINMTTPGGKVPRKNALPTSASRALGINLTKAMANEYAPENILVNTICLGLIKSAQHERRWERSCREGETLRAYYERMGANVPVGRYGEAEEVGDLVAFLASGRAAFITGTAINIDGGASEAV